MPRCVGVLYPVIFLTSVGFYVIRPERMGRWIHNCLHWCVSLHFFSCLSPGEEVESFESHEALPCIVETLVRKHCKGREEFSISPSEATGEEILDDSGFVSSQFASPLTKSMFGSLHDAGILFADDSMYLTEDMAMGDFDEQMDLDVDKNRRLMAEIENVKVAIHPLLNSFVRTYSENPLSRPFISIRWKLSKFTWRLILSVCWSICFCPNLQNCWKSMLLWRGKSMSPRTLLSFSKLASTIRIRTNLCLIMILTFRSLPPSIEVLQFETINGRDSKMKIRLGMSCRFWNRFRSLKVPK